MMRWARAWQIGEDCDLLQRGRAATLQLLDAFLRTLAKCAVVRETLGQSLFAYGEFFFVAFEQFLLLFVAIRLRSIDRRLDGQTDILGQRGDRLSEQ